MGTGFVVAVQEGMVLAVEEHIVDRVGTVVLVGSIQAVGRMDIEVEGTPVGSLVGTLGGHSHSEEVLVLEDTLEVVLGLYFFEVAHLVLVVVCTHTDGQQSLAEVVVVARKVNEAGPIINT